MSARPRFLVGTLHCGENELAACTAALRAQEDVDVEHFVLSDLPNREAHATIYERFMTRSSDFDLFLKLDADMVLRGSRKLADVAALFARDSGVDHAQITVHDWFSDAAMMGVHVYTGSVRWRQRHGADEELFVDPYPECPGRRIDVRDGIAPLVDHCPDPSPYQAFHFGVHRALKVVQRGRDARRFDAPRSWHQFRFLQRTWQHFTRDGDRRLGLAVLGADLVLLGRLGASRVEHKGDELRDAFERVKDLDVEEIRDCLSVDWARPVRASLRHFARVQLRSALRKAARVLPAGGSS